MKIRINEHDGFVALLTFILNMSIVWYMSRLCIGDRTGNLDGTTAEMGRGVSERSSKDDTAVSCMTPNHG